MVFLVVNVAVIVNVKLNSFIIIAIIPLKLIIWNKDVSLKKNYDSKKKLIIKITKASNEVRRSDFFFF